MERKVLLLGAGSNHELRAPTPLSHITPKITTLDIEPRHKPDVQWDLNILDWPFNDNEFDEIHAYEVLEHLGRQGDFKSFFDHFGEIYRILRPLGVLAASCPRWDSVWAWGDPSHRRIINEGTLSFLDQTRYSEVGKTAMTDFRSVWKGDFEVTAMEKTSDQFYFVLKVHKPARA
jgi:predicted SAM-dependent methyltransferase